MKRLIVLSLALTCAALFTGFAGADDAADVKALVEKGVAMVKEKGLDGTLKAIGDPKSALVKDDLYLFAGPLDKVTLSAHPFAADKLVGPDLAAMKDSKGNQIFVKFKEIAEKPGSGWVEYWWPKPGSKEPSLKKTFIMRVPGQNLYIAAGYHPK
ncbi:MAG: cache domain-containing protein [Pseudomonadota bacterium]